MSKMTLRMHNALKSTLKGLASSCPKGVLCYGFNKLTQESFCKPINVLKASKRLLSCTMIEIRGLGSYQDIEAHFVSWIKNHIREPANTPQWCNLLSPHNWLRYNISDNLNCLKLSLGNIDYYMILREEWLLEFRRIAFKY